MLLSFWGNKLWHRFKSDIQMFHDVFWVGLYWCRFTAGNGCANTKQLKCRRSYVVFRWMYYVTRQSSSRKKKNWPGNVIDVSQPEQCHLDHPGVTLRSVLSWCKLGKVLSMALAHSFYVKTEAQRQVKFSAVLKLVQKKKIFFLCKYVIVNISW